MKIPRRSAVPCHMSRRLAAAVAALSLGLALPSFAQSVPEPVEEIFPTLTGRLLDRTRESVTLADGSGNTHTFRVTDQTRYVYGESSQPSDLRPGARVRAEYRAFANQRVLLAVWVLGGPTS